MRSSERGRDEARGGTGAKIALGDRISVIGVRVFDKIAERWLSGKEIEWNIESLPGFELPDWREGRASAVQRSLLLRRDDVAMDAYGPCKGETVWWPASSGLGVFALDFHYLRESERDSSSFFEVAAADIEFCEGETEAGDLDWLLPGTPAWQPKITAFFDKARTSPKLPPGTPAWQPKITSFFGTRAAASRAEGGNPEQDSDSIGASLAGFLRSLLPPGSCTPLRDETNPRCEWCDKTNQDTDLLVCSRCRCARFCQACFKMAWNGSGERPGHKRVCTSREQRVDQVFEKLRLPEASRPVVRDAVEEALLRTGERVEASRILLLSLLADLGFTPGLAQFYRTGSTAYLSAALSDAVNLLFGSKICPADIELVESKLPSREKEQLAALRARMAAQFSQFPQGQT